MSDPKAKSHAELAMQRGGTPGPVQTFEDGSALFGCVGWRHAGEVWISNHHFIACVGKTAPKGELIDCPASFVAALGRVPTREFVPVQLADRVRVGKLFIEKVYFHTMTEWYGVTVRWRAGEVLEDGVYVMRDNEVVAIVEAFETVPLGTCPDAKR